VIAMMKKENYVKFQMHNHTKLWKELNAKDETKGYGVQIAKTWYWYEKWIKEVRSHCAKQSSKYL
jgi:hypothetical protein